MSAEKDYPHVDPTILLARPRPAVNLRSVLVGLAGVIVICGFTPFNDYVLNNTPMIGGSMPLVVVMFFFLFALLVNGPLSRFAPRQALGSHELAVVLCMLLVACVLPAAGLMQFWPPSLIGAWRHAQDKPAIFDEMFEKLKLPTWFWTTFPEGAKSADRAQDEIVTQFYGRIPPDWPFWSVFWVHVKRWIPPTIGWGVFFVSLFGAILGIGFILRKQWVENERITFPIGQVQAALIETPTAGSYFNATFSSRAFWVGMALMVFIRGINGLCKYFPKYVPEIPLSYNLYDIFKDRAPWSYVEHIHAQTLFPIVAAIMFFASTRIAFSLWFTVILWQLPAMAMGTAGVIPQKGYNADSNTGALLAFALMIVITGRQHYWRVIRQMFTRGRPEEQKGDFIRYRTAGWMALLGTALSLAWLMRVGMTPMGAAILLFGLLTTWVVMAYVVAHSGFPVAITSSGPRQWILDIYRNPNPVGAYSVGDVANEFHTQTIGGMWSYTRDQLLNYTNHGLKAVTDFAPRAGRRILAVMVLSLVVGFFVSEGSTLYCYYKYASTQDKKQVTPINKEVLEDAQPRWTMTFIADVHAKGRAPQHKRIGEFGWMGGTFALTSLLAFLQLRFSWWPLHPIGLLMLFSFPIRRISFSIFVGWLAKVLILRFGGGGLFRKARPFFMGIIVGEVTAAGLFAVAALVLHLAGVPYEVVQFLPTAQD